MKRSAISIPSPLKTLRFPVAGLALVCFLDGPPRQAWAQTAKSDDPAQTRTWAPAAIEHAQKMRLFRDADRAGRSAADKCAVRWRRTGLSAVVVDPRNWKDFAAMAEALCHG